MCRSRRVLRADGLANAARIASAAGLGWYCVSNGRAIAAGPSHEKRSVKPQVEKRVQAATALQARAASP